MTTVIVQENGHDLTLADHTLEVGVHTEVQEVTVTETPTGLDITQIAHDIVVNPFYSNLLVTEEPVTVHVAAGVPGPQGPQGPPGADGASDWGDIGGVLAHQTDLHAELEDRFRVSRRFDELANQTERMEAITNLGLNVIDGGSFL